MSESGTASPLDLDGLASLHEKWKYGPGKNISIVRSSSALVSVVASALLVWILFRSRDGIKTTYHRLLLCLSVSDILLSLSSATFGAVVPSELGYVVWNARGSRASCDAFGFVSVWGGYSGLIYMCSLNLYYLAKVKFNKTDHFIKTKLERWLLGVPALYGLILGIILVAKQRMNADLDGNCSAANAYEPPHCEGYEDGEIPEGFEIPCGRGRSVEPVAWATGFITLFLVPITIGGSLWVIYRSVLRAEQRIARYGARTLRFSRAPPTTNDAATNNVEGGGSGGRRESAILSAFKRQFGGRGSRASSNNRESSQSRAVLHRAAAYSVGYFMTWIWAIVIGFLILAGAWTTDLPQPKWQVAYLYVSWFFSPLQGLWTLLIYMQPSVIKRKRSSEGSISWFRASADALWSAVTGGNTSARRPRDRAGLGTWTTTAALRTETNPTSIPPEGRNTSATIGSTIRQDNFARAESVSPDAEDPEEEKRGAQECKEAEVAPCPHDVGRDDEAVAPRRNVTPPPGPEAPGESRLSSYSARETGSTSRFSTRETLSSYYSTRETLSSYYSARETLSDGDVSWFRAFADALRSAVTGGNNSAGRGRNRAGAGAPRSAAAPGRTGTNPAHAPGPEGRNTSAAVSSTNQQGICTPAESVGLEVKDAEGENREIQEYEPV